MTNEEKINYMENVIATFGLSQEEIDTISSANIQVTKSGSHKLAIFFGFDKSNNSRHKKFELYDEQEAHDAYSAAAYYITSKRCGSRQRFTPDKPKEAGTVVSEVVPDTKPEIFDSDIFTGNNENPTPDIFG